ncbi:MAG: choice-of-anchor J domain-containing protein, partial [Candidatus Coatesbacteria bacterium]
VDDVEGDTESIWTHSGDNDMWHVEDYRSHTPSHSWKCGGEDDGDYGNNMNAKLTSPAVYVPNEAPELSFRTCYWVQGGGNDNCFVEVSTDGDDWNSVGTFYGTVDEWTKRTYYLSDYAGQKVYVRFRFDTNGSVTNEGWYIDDISVAEGDTTDAGGLVVYDFVANPKDDGLLLSWEADDEEGVEGYDLYRRPESDDSDTFALVSGASGNRRVIDAEAGFVKVNSELITGTGAYRYFDGNLEPGETYEYLLKAVYAQIDRAVGNTTGEVGLPTAFALSQNRPNPFSTSSTVSFAVPKPARVEMVIYDLAGRKVVEVVNRDFEPGTYDVPISSDGLGSGIYLLRMSAGGEFTAVKKLVVTR